MRCNCISFFDFAILAKRLPMLERLRIFAWPFLLVLNDERYFSSTNASTVLPEYSLPISSKNAVLVSAKSNSYGVPVGCTLCAVS